MIRYTVVAVCEDGVEVWDGESKIGHPQNEPATMMLPVERSSKFEVGDIVDLVVVLRERPEKDDG